MWWTGLSQEKREAAGRDGHKDSGERWCKFEYFFLSSLQQKQLTVISSVCTSLDNFHKNASY